MDITHIKTFIEVSRTRHFGKAAKSLFITQSAVSARIRLLEEALGVRLLTRDRNNIQLTAAGTRFLPLAEQMLDTWNLARQTTGLDEESKTLFSIGAIFSLWESGIQNMIFDFYVNKPKVAVNLVAETQEQLFRSVLEGNIDAAIMYEEPRLSDLATTQLGHLELVLASTRTNQTVASALNDSNYVYVNWGTEFSMIHARNFPNIPTPSIRVDFARIALNFLLVEGGSAYLAKSMIDKELDAELLSIVQGAPVIKRKYYLVYRTNSGKHDMIKKLSEAFNSK